MSEAAFLEKALEPHFRFAKVPQSLLHPEYQRSGAGSCIIYVFCRRPGAGPLPTTTGAAVTELPSNAANVKLDIKEEHKQPPGRNNGQGGGKENRGSQKRHHRLMLAQGGPMMPLAGSYARLSATMGLLRFGFKAPQSRGQKKRRTLTSTSHR